MPDIKVDHVVLAAGASSTARCRRSVKSGETVTINTISGGPDQFPSSSSFDILPENPGIIATLKPKLGLHILIGPVAVEGAEPGDMLEERIDKIDSGRTGAII
jgi:acetamidase/formamidase